MVYRGRAILVVLAVVLAGCSGAGPTGEPKTGMTTATPSQATGATTAVATPTPVPATKPQVTVTVEKVVDGDTIRIRYQNDTTDTVRMLGVDTPETYGENTPEEFSVPSTAAGKECLSTWGEKAKSFATQRLAGQTIKLGFDPNEGRRGYYGRLLAYVWVDGEQFNYDLIRQGYARMYESNFVERPRYEPAEKRAREARRGLWTCITLNTDGGSTSTAQTTTATADSSGAPLSISVHADAAGNDNENLNDEYVTLTNTGDTTLDLSGWTIADEAGHTYTLADGTSLDPGATFTLYSGSGTDTETDRYWGRSGAVWNNAGDTVTVRDASGTVVATYQYGS